MKKTNSTIPIVILLVLASVVGLGAILYPRYQETRCLETATQPFYFHNYLEPYLRENGLGWFIPGQITGAPYSVTHYATLSASEKAGIDLVGEGLPIHVRFRADYERIGSFEYVAIVEMDWTTCRPSRSIKPTILEVE